MTVPQQRPHRSKQDYATPMIFINAVKSLLSIDRFAFDFAADLSNHKASRYWMITNDALSQPPAAWKRQCGSDWGWLNPPYASIGPWAKKCLEASRQGAKIAFLVPASVGSNWFRDYIHGAYGVRVLFLNGRIPFIPDKPNWLYPKDCMLVLFGDEDAPPYSSDIWTWR